MSQFTFVVTGARGFLGSIFSLRAVERGHRVLALDDESRGLNPIENKIGAAYQRFDCGEGIAPALRAAGIARIDGVAHFAAATGSLERPLDELRVLNVDMTQHVYQDALTLGAKAFLWPTTSLAIGVPDSPYVLSKEEALAKLKEVDAAARISVPLRFFNVTGAYKGLSERRKNEVHILPTMLQSYRTGAPFIINGDDYETVDGTPSRDFVNVVDVVDYLLDLAEWKIQHNVLPVQPHPKDGAVWLGKRRSTTVKQLVAMFEQWLGPVQTRIGPRRLFDCGALDCDVDQAAQFEQHRGGLVPTWISVRDELEALQEERLSSVMSGEIVVAASQPVETHG